MTDHKQAPVAGDAASTATIAAPARGTVAAVVYSRNESALLPACLGALEGFDDLLVCNMQSTDSTESVAASFGARTLTVPDARVVEEVRQLGLDAAHGEWVLFVDADEIVPPGFADHMRALAADAESDGTAAYLIRYTTVAFGRTLTDTMTGSAKPALLRRSATRFPDVGRAHVPPHLDGPLRAAPAAVPPVLHLNFRGAEQTVEKALRYARDAAYEPALLTPLGLLRELARATVFNGSWRDGRAGVAVSVSGVVGRWYGALLAADAGEGVDAPLGNREARVLGALTSVQETYHRAKLRLNRVRARRTTTGRVP